ncbi:hypothetical protein [Actinomadura miaoliensis]|uniref:hypothetical protein n=1 Tax=Actinomadura miaoliensis TaxID=430685 RepID=UPI0031E76AEE
MADRGSSTSPTPRHGLAALIELLNQRDRSRVRGGVIHDKLEQMTIGSAILWGLIVGGWQLLVHDARTRMVYIYMFGVLALGSLGWAFFAASGDGFDSDLGIAALHFGIATALVAAFTPLTRRKRGAQERDAETVAGKHWQDLP